MAQSTDFVVDDGSGVSLLAQLNAMLPALASSNQGATAPPNPMPGMLFFDTSVSPPILRMRNAGNTTYVDVHTETIAPNVVRGNASGSFAQESSIEMTTLRTMLGQAQLLAGNGWIRHPGGFIEQWFITGTAGPGINATVSFPVTFPVACTGVWTQIANTSADLGVGENYVAQVRGYWNSAFSIRNLGPSAAQYLVKAVGY